MQDINELKKKLEQINQELTKVATERARLHDKLQALDSKKVPDTRYDAAQTGSSQNITKPGHQVMVLAISALGVISLTFLGITHNALSKVSNNSSFEQTVFKALNNGQIERQDLASSQVASQATKRAPRHASKRQWGPLLAMPGTKAGKQYYGFDPTVKAQQESLLTLGFDIGKADGYKGKQTRQAIAEFRSLYLQDSADQLQDNELTPIMENYANLAHNDASRFGIDHGVVAAIRLSSIRTGVDFAYLMKLAATESNFNPKIEAPTSSATGLFQFTHDTWLNTVKKYGEQFGILADYAANIDYRVSRSGYQRPVVRNKAVYDRLLELRKNPRVSAIMAAETVLEGKQKLALVLDREPSETDLYLAHFLGEDKAITFLQSLAQSPDMHATELFPDAASSNRDIFHSRQSNPRTLNDLYTHFDEKFSTRRYNEPQNDSSFSLAKYL